jgi:hypothetical protein
MLNWLEYTVAVIQEQGMKYPSWYAIFVGSLLILFWGGLILSGNVPEFDHEPWAIAHHITAEVGMAVTLLVGAWGVLKARGWGRQCLLVGLGMLIYSAVNSAGYYAQAGNWGIVLLFAAILASAVLVVTRVIRSKPADFKRHGR